MTLQNIQLKLNKICNDCEVINIFKNDKNKLKCELYCKKYNLHFERRVSHFLNGHKCKGCPEKRLEMIETRISNLQKYLDENILNNPLTISKDEEKRYTITCSLCKTTWRSDLESIKNYKNCPRCKIHKNLIKNSFPEIIPYLKNKDDAEKYTSQSSQKIIFRCPFCGYEKESVIANVYKQGFTCDICSPNISFPEKIMASILLDNKILFEKQYSPTWANNKKYDFYLPELKIIIETHGIQHFKDNKMLKTTKEKQQSIDKTKKTIAIEKGIEYFEIDCSVSSFEYIYNSIIQSGLKERLNLVINKKQEILLYGNDIKKTCWDLYNNNVDIKIISKIVSRDIRTVREYLKLGHKLGLCTYEKYSSTQIVKLNPKTNEIEETFENAQQASRTLNIPKTTLVRWCNKGQKKYVEEYVVMWKKDFEKQI